MWYRQPHLWPFFVKSVSCSAESFNQDKKDQPNAAISAIPLEQLGTKEWNKGKNYVDTSNDERFSRDEADQEEGREDLAYNEEELVKKF